MNLIDLTCEIHIDVENDAGYTSRNPIILDSSDSESSHSKTDTFRKRARNLNGHFVNDPGPSSSIPQDIGKKKRREPVVPSPAPYKKPKRELTPIVVDSDSEHDTSDLEVDLSYSEFFGYSEYDMDVDQPHPLQVDSREEEIEEIQPRTPYKLPKFRPPHKRRQLYSLEPQKPFNFVWNLYSDLCLQKPKSFRHSSKLPKLHLVEKFRRSAGSVIKIAQQNGNIAIGSATPGGDTDQPSGTEQVEYNESGVLVVYHNSPVVLPGHRRHQRKPRPQDQPPLHRMFNERSDSQTLFTKFYSVNDLCFYPPNNDGTTILASTGCDGYVRFWSLGDEDGGVESCHYKCSSAPHAAVLKQDCPVLAVGENDLVILPDPDSQPSTLDNQANRGSHRIGEIVWGHSATNGSIFASNEPKALDADEESTHMAFDVERCALLYCFDAAEAGESIAIHPDGCQLSLVTERHGYGMMRIYDIRRKNPKAMQTIHLPRFQGLTEERLAISSATYSPDGIYLALPRNDNSTQVYDTRMLSRGCAANLVHTGPSKVNPGGYSFGIVAHEWVMTRSQQLRLVTGGGDGCVRLWDPLIDSDSCSNGQVIAETNADIGYFSIGNRYREEHDLVIGDADGTVYIFDGQQPFFWTL